MAMESQAMSLFFNDLQLTARMKSPFAVKTATNPSKGSLLLAARGTTKRETGKQLSTSKGSLLLAARGTTKRETGKQLSTSKGSLLLAARGTTKRETGKQLSTLKKQNAMAMAIRMRQSPNRWFGLLLPLATENFGCPSQSCTSRIRLGTLSPEPLVRLARCRPKLRCLRQASVHLPLPVGLAWQMISRLWQHCQFTKLAQKPGAFKFGIFKLGIIQC